MRKCHTAYKTKIIGPGQSKHNFYLSKRMLGDVILDIFEMRKKKDPQWLSNFQNERETFLMLPARD